MGGATKAAQQAAQQAAARPPRGPFRLASWRHVSTGELLQVPIPLSVFAKQGGAVWAKWRQRAWRGLYSLACQLGEVQEPAGCYDSGGQPLWDDLAEEDAALDKFPFCVPQKVCGIWRVGGCGWNKRVGLVLVGACPAADAWPRVCTQAGRQRGPPGLPPAFPTQPPPTLAFTFPSQCRAQLLGLGTTERLKSRVLW